jgi:hypothetical protein
MQGCNLATKSAPIAHGQQSTPMPPGGFIDLPQAFNDLHALAQKFEKPFDAPAILVVGHQTDGKSALVEALIGFQFNDVGGGTRTRRPLALHLRYNPACGTPVCVLVRDDLSEQAMSLPELQACGVINQWINQCE